MMLSPDTQVEREGRSSAEAQLLMRLIEAEWTGKSVDVDRLNWALKHDEDFDA